jgi:predicted house-cleaning noncanonical NTP pyrophosphatase (MazG superfamily)
MKPDHQNFSKARQDAFVTQHYNQLNGSIYKNLRKCYSEDDKEELAQQVWVLLLEVINRLAFIHDDWAEDLDCLRQSQTKIRFLCLDVMELTIRRTKVTDSYDSLCSDLDQGQSVPPEFLQAITAPDDQNPERQLMRKQLHEAIRSFATSDYEHALLDWVMGETMAKHIIERFSVSKNTVTANRDQLLAKIRLNLIIEDCI